MEQVNVSDHELLQQYKLKVNELTQEAMMYKAALEQVLREKNGGKENDKQVGQASKNK